MIGLYYCHLPDDLSASALPDLTAYRQERLARTRNALARRQSLGAELVLQHALQDWAPALSWPPEILVGEQGKPYLREGGLFFSLSHSGSWAACAVAKRELGLDIQEKRLGSEKLLERCFTAKEQDFIRASTDPASAFTGLWCRKESRIKAEGSGIFDGLLSFSALEREEEYCCGCLEELHYAVCVPGACRPEIHIRRITLP